MGSSESKTQQSGSQQHARPGLHPSTHHPAAYRDTEPRIILGNQSSHSISYWVAEEDKKHKKRTKASHDRFIACMDLHLNGSNPCECTPAAAGEEEQAMGGGAKEKKIVDGEEEEEEGGDVAYFLTRDHRMEPMGRTQATKVPFPVDCRDMRVCAFFKGGDDQRWRLFEDRVYSIGLFKKVFRFTASDADIAQPCIIINGPENR